MTTKLSTEPATSPAADSGRRTLSATLWAGLILSVATIAALIVDQAGTNTLGTHLRDIYPASYSDENLTSAKGVLLTYLFTVGGLGVIGWLVGLRAVRRGYRRTTALLWTLFGLGTAIAVTNLLITEKDYGTLLPTWLGLVGLLPSIAGLAAVLLHRRTPALRQR